MGADRSPTRQTPACAIQPSAGKFNPQIAAAGKSKSKSKSKSGSGSGSGSKGRVIRCGIFSESGWGGLPQRAQRTQRGIGRGACRNVGAVLCAALVCRNGMSRKFSKTEGIRGIAPTHPHNQVENATASSAGGSLVRDGRKAAGCCHYPIGRTSSVLSEKANGEARLGVAIGLGIERRAWDSGQEKPGAPIVSILTQLGSEV